MSRKEPSSRPRSAYLSRDQIAARRTCRPPLFRSDVRQSSRFCARGTWGIASRPRSRAWRRVTCARSSTRAWSPLVTTSSNPSRAGGSAPPRSRTSCCRITIRIARSTSRCSPAPEFTTSGPSTRTMYGRAAPAEGFHLSLSVVLWETPGHTLQDVTTLVGTKHGIAAFTHLWWNAQGPTPDPIAVDLRRLSRHRRRVLEVSRTIVPGHGAPFSPNPAPCGDRIPTWWLAVKSTPLFD
jgi:hypothetical protein